MVKLSHKLIDLEFMSLECGGYQPTHPKVRNLMSALYFLSMAWEYEFDHINVTNGADHSIRVLLERGKRRIGLHFRDDGVGLTKQGQERKRTKVKNILDAVAWVIGDDQYIAGGLGDITT